MNVQRGVALLMVLWVLAVLSTLLGALAATVQLQNRQAQWQVAHTRAMFAAEAGLSQAVMALQARDPKARWTADGVLHELRFDEAQLSVSVYSERGKLDLNAASTQDVGRLLTFCGADPQALASSLEALTRQRLDPVPLRTLEEFRQMPGMSYALFRCMAPWITVWSGQAQPDPGFTPVPLAKALGLPVVRSPGADPGQMFTVVSQALLPNGDRATLQATLMLTSVKEGARPFRVLRWQE
ncbi:type II secretion system minor pseudopilin GspK [Pseudomonas sp. F3-2]|uniref:general secretion pathway protein GspK n=1 Tax=Pseudomonas sp. F3-2 TaxID=3141539 RepID=UPI00315C629B